MVDEKKSSSLSRTEKVIGWPKYFLILALGATIIGALLSSKMIFGIDKKIADAKEAARPASIKLTKITVPSCADCFLIDNAVADLKKQNVSVGEEKSLTSDSPEGQDLIKKLGIKKIPTYILTGEVNKKSLGNFIQSNGEVKNDTFVFTKVPPVFIDTQTNNEMGRVAATIITDPYCPKCFNPQSILDSYTKAGGVKFASTKKVVWNSAEGKQLINKYKITRVPTLLLSSDIDLYANVIANFKGFGTTQEQDKTYVAHTIFPPYLDIIKGQLVGFVKIIYLTDSSCSDCYKPQEVHRNILTKGFGVAFSSERTVDANSDEGKSLISKYKIAKIPTVIMSSETGDYPGLKNVWNTVGTVESDGWYAFRGVDQLGVTYKDLTTSKIVKPSASGSNP